jgi:hypothetical protein
MSRVRIMLTVAAAVAGALPRASAFAPGAPLGALRARLSARARAGTLARARAGGARMVATEPAGVKESPQPSPDFKFSMEDITSVCKRRGFIFPSSEIYQGTPAHGEMFAGPRLRVLGVARSRVWEHAGASRMLCCSGALHALSAAA